MTAEFCCAPSAVAGIRREPPDILLLDIELETGTGMDVLKAVSTEFPATKVIMLTNCTEAIYHAHFINAGAYAFYDKSRELAALRSTLERLASA